MSDSLSDQDKLSVVKELVVKVSLLTVQCPSNHHILFLNLRKLLLIVQNFFPGYSELDLVYGALYDLVFVFIAYSFLEVRDKYADI